ncbi:DNA-binding NtrC family response regulator [Pseudomonas sp. S30_BP2TU TE3576]|uniref:response regulator n=1 Tax=Pseudomonas sp. S30_BP2TU TE3576 TaxID=3349329 RepID=UPI003D195955
MQVTNTEPLTALIPTRDSGPLRLFVVEDLNAVRVLWGTASPRIAGLSLAGAFHCASTAIAAIRREPPDVVLLDVNLSDGHGMEVLRVVAAEYPLTKVIVVSNCAGPRHWKYFTNAGAYASYDKINELAAMRRMLERLAKSLLPAARTFSPASGYAGEQIARVREDTGVAIRQLSAECALHSR